MEIFLAVFSLLLIISVFLSLIKLDFWIYKILEYPRLQKLALIIMVAGSWFFFWPIQYFLSNCPGWFVPVHYLPRIQNMALYCSFKKRNAKSAAH
jgi:hypothetical protein